MELSISLSRSQPSPALCALILILNALVGASGEQESENLSGLSTDPFEDIFVLRENGTTCLMADFAAKILVPYDARASNYVDLITEQAEITIPRGARVKGKCGSVRAELHISWLDKSFILTIFFLKETHNISQVQERFWEMNKIQLVYDTSQIYFKDAVNPGKHTAMSHHLRLFQTPEGKSYKCKAQETLLLISSDHKKMVSLFLSQTHIQPFDISSDFIFSEATKCTVDQQERLEETLPLILGLTLGLLIVVMLTVYHIHQKYTTTARQTQVPRDRAQYKHM